MIHHILMKKGNHVHSIAPHISLLEAVGVLRQHRIGAVLVLDSHQHILGVLSERDVVRAIGHHGAAALTHSVDTVMTSPVITCTPHESISQAMALMSERRFRHLPVVDNGALAGMVSIGDLVKARIEETEREATALKEYITQG